MSACSPSYGNYDSMAFHRNILYLMKMNVRLRAPFHQCIESWTTNQGLCLHSFQKCHHFAIQNWIHVPRKFDEFIGLATWLYSILSANMFAPCLFIYYGFRFKQSPLRLLFPSNFHASFKRKKCDIWCKTGLHWPPVNFFSIDNSSQFMWMQLISLCHEQRAVRTAYSMG